MTRVVKKVMHRFAIFVSKLYTIIIRPTTLPQNSWLFRFLRINITDFSVYDFFLASAHHVLGQQQPRDTQTWPLIGCFERRQVTVFVLRKFNRWLWLDFGLIFCLATQ